MAEAAGDAAPANEKDGADAPMENGLSDTPRGKRGRGRGRRSAGGTPQTKRGAGRRVPTPGSPRRTRSRAVTEVEGVKNPLEEDLASMDGGGSSESSQMSFPNAPAAVAANGIPPGGDEIVDGFSSGLADALPQASKPAESVAASVSNSDSPCSSKTSSRTASPSGRARGGRRQRGRGGTRARNSARLAEKEEAEKEAAAEKKEAPEKEAVEQTKEVAPSPSLPNGIATGVKAMILNEPSPNKDGGGTGVQHQHHHHIRDELYEHLGTGPGYSDQDQSSDEPLVPIHNSQLQRRPRDAPQKYGYNLDKQPRVQLKPLSLDLAQLARMRGSTGEEKKDAAAPAKPKEEAVNEDTKREIAERLSQFEHITENRFMCARKVNKQAGGMECDCMLSREDTAAGRKGCGDDCLNRMLMIECGKQCSLGQRCSNKRFQKVENAPVEVFKTDKKGFGLRAVEDIPADEFIMEYVGDVLSPSQFRKRAKDFAKRGAPHFYFMALTTERVIDASHRGNVSRFINHSCEPNAETQKWTVNGEVRVGFFSKRAIRRGEEVTFDYKYERYGQKAQKCYCESSRCRGWLGGEPDKSDEEDEDEEEGEEDVWSTSSDDEEEEEETSLTPVGRKALDQAPSKTEEDGSPVRSAKPASDSEEISPEKEEREIKPRRRRRRVKRRSPRKIKNYEKTTYEELEALKAHRVRNRQDVIDLMKLVVHATDTETRLTLLQLAIEAETPCRRLFIDYRILTLMKAWNESLGWSKEDLEVKLRVLKLLDCLPLPNKTELKAAKLLQDVTVWSKASNAEEEAEIREKMRLEEEAEKAKLAAEQERLAKLAEQAKASTSSLEGNMDTVDGSSRRSSQSNTRSQTPAQDSDYLRETTSSISSPTPESQAKAERFQNQVLRAIRSTSWDSSDTTATTPSPVPPTPEPSAKPMETSNPFDACVLDDDALPPGEEETAMDISFSSDKEIEVAPGVADEYAEKSAEEAVEVKKEEKVEKQSSDSLPQPMETKELLEIKEDKCLEEKPVPIKQETPEEIFSAASQAVKEIVDKISSQDVDEAGVQSDERMDDRVSPDVEPVSKPETAAVASEDAEVCTKVREIMELAARLLESWKNLKEAFKIPKRERNKVRAEHEREADKAAAANADRQLQSLRRDISGQLQQQQQQQQSTWSQDSSGSQQQVSQWSKTNYNNYHRPGPFSRAAQPRERRISRFDDQSGLLHKPLSREHRRQLFMLKADVQAREEKRRKLLQMSHENKCYYLGLHAPTTATFPEYPRYYLNPETTEWMEMPAEYPEVDVTWGYARMAELPLEAFQPGDPPFTPALNPAYVYPPGVVPVSFFYGVPLGEDDEKVAEAMRQQEEEHAMRMMAMAEAAAVRMEEQQRREGERGATTPPRSVPFLNADPDSEMPFANGGPEPITVQPDYEAAAPSTSGQDPSVSSTASSVPVTNAAGTSNGYNSSNRGSRPVVVRLPPGWKLAKDAEGRAYYYNAATKEVQWEPPAAPNDPEAEDKDAELVDCETASLVEVGQGNAGEDNSDDEEDEDEEEEENGNGGEEEAAKRQAEIEILSSDLSAQEKELLLARRKKTKAERRMERRQKREMNREKMEYERKRRRERHHKHRKSGLVTEHLIPKRTEKDKLDLMTFKELRERLANRDAIRESQDKEERAEAMRELLLEKQRQREERAAAKLQQQQQQQQQSAVAATTAEPTTTAAADTSSEVAKKIKERFKKETSKVIVKFLDPYRRPDAIHGKIKNNEDFKHLAKKLTTYIMSKELKHIRRIEDLKCSDSVKKKAHEFIRKYMLKFTDGYKPSPQS